MHLYAFGSVCRGEIDRDSDIDLLALVSGHDNRLEQSKYSIYSYSKMKKMWFKGSPFAWHLALESRLLFASDDSDFLKSLGQPSSYVHFLSDCEKFYGVFLEARSSLTESTSSRVFDFSTIFLSVRNIATCFSLGVLGQPIFSRHAALRMPPDFKLPISERSYRILERSRILCTRSVGSDIAEEEAGLVLSECDNIDHWMTELVKKAKSHERIQQSS